MYIISILVSGAVLFCTMFLMYIIYLSRHFGVFKKLGIKGPTPWPGVGNLFTAIVREGFLPFHQRLYEEYENEKVYGIHLPGQPVMIVKDLDMIKDICIKNFNNFVNRNSMVDEEPFGCMLTTLKDDRWKRVRNIVSPTFSSGKLKRLCPHIEHTSRILLDNLRKVHEKGETLELKDLMSHFTMDVIASTGFGVEVNSLEDKDNPFAKKAHQLMNFGLATIALAMLFPILIPLFAKLGIGFFSPKTLRFMTDFVDAALANRKDEKVSHKRSDFIQLIVESEQTSGESADSDYERKHLTKAEIQGQGIVFLLAGYDTTSTALSFTFFLLANHPECCQKVQEELDKALEGRFPTYESVQELPYLDMCLNEAMRMYPPGFLLDRACKEDCDVQGVRFLKGMVVLFPVKMIHNDPKIWEEPEKFDPERFNAVNKSSRHPFAHLPFGQGPRNCIGMRLALLEMKISIAAILQGMTPRPCEKTVYPPKLGKNRLNSEAGLWIKMVPREKNSN